MASIELTRSSADGARVGARLLSVVSGLGDRFAAWNDARLTRNALSRLSDRELDDIGLTRGDLGRIAGTRRF